MTNKTKTQVQLEQQLAKAKERVDQLKARKRRLDAQQRAREAKQRRADDTRRKILLGAYVLQRHSEQEIQNMLDSYLTEERDRVLFDLPPRAETP